MKEPGFLKPDAFMSFIRLFSAIASIALAIALLPAQAAHAQKQKEIRVISQHGDGGPGELMSLEALAGYSDAVIVGKIQAARPSSIPPRGSSADAFFSTAYTLKVEQVLRGPKQFDPPVSSVVVEVLGVGDVDRGAYIERHLSERFRELAMGATYVLFITKYALGRSADATVVWVPATGDGQSIIGIRSGNVAPQATTRVALSLASLTPAALFDKIKQLPRGDHY